MTTFTGLADYHQLILGPGGDLPIFPADGDAAALAIVVGDSLILNTGVAAGPVTVTISDSPAPEKAGWRETQELSLTVTDSLYLLELAPIAGEPKLAFTPTKPGPHRVTIWARGRDNAYDLYLDPDTIPVEQFRILFSAS